MEREANKGGIGDMEDNLKLLRGLSLLKILSNGIRECGKDFDAGIMTWWAPDEFPVTRERKIGVYGVLVMVGGFKGFSLGFSDKSVQKSLNVFDHNTGFSYDIHYGDLMLGRDSDNKGKLVKLLEGFYGMESGEWLSLMDFEKREGGMYIRAGAWNKDYGAMKSVPADEILVSMNIDAYIKWVIDGRKG